RPPALSPLALHDALPISLAVLRQGQLELLGSHIGDGFERRGGRVEAAHDEVVERLALAELVEGLLVQSGDELLRVERGHGGQRQDRKSTRLNSSHVKISY